jgi:hypothetical protein
MVLAMNFAKISLSWVLALVALLSPYPARAALWLNTVCEGSGTGTDPVGVTLQAFHNTSDIAARLQLKSMVIVRITNAAVPRPLEFAIDSVDLSYTIGTRAYVVNGEGFTISYHRDGRTTSVYTYNGTPLHLTCRQLRRDTVQRDFFAALSLLGPITPP